MVYSVTKTKILVIALLIEIILYYIMYVLEVFLGKFFNKNKGNENANAD